MPPIDRKKIRNKINKLKEGTKPGEWGDLLGMTTSQIKNYDYPNRKMPMEYVLRVAEKLDISADWLIFDIGEKDADLLDMVSKDIALIRQEIEKLINSLKSVEETIIKIREKDKNER